MPKNHLPNRAPCPYVNNGVSDCGDMHCNGTRSDGCFPASGLQKYDGAIGEFYNCANHPEDQAHFLVVEPVRDGHMLFVHAECAKCNPESFYSEAGMGIAHVYRLPGAEAALQAAAEEAARNN